MIFQDPSASPTMFLRNSGIIIAYAVYPAFLGSGDLNSHSFRGKCFSTDQPLAAL